MQDFATTGHTTRSRVGRAVAALALAGAAVLGAAGPAGAHGGDTSKIHACVLPAGGGLKIVAPDESCARNDVPLDWSAEDTATTYSAGSGLSLSAGNVFSVIGAPWAGLTGVPSGFSDGVDDDGTVRIDELQGVLAADDGLPNETSDLVSFSRLKDLITSAGDGRITGAFIRNGSIAGEDIAQGAITAGNIAGSYASDVAGAVTSEKIRDGSVEARDLAPGVIDRTITTLGVDPQAAAAASRIAVTVPVPVTADDIVTVSPPAALEDTLVFAGSDVLTPGSLTIYLHNISGAAVDGMERTWTVRRLQMVR